MKKRIQLLITSDDLALLDELAHAEKKIAQNGEVGYRPAVIHRFLEMFRDSGLSPKDFVDSRCVIVITSPTEAK